MWALVYGGILTNNTLQKQRPNCFLNFQWCIVCCKNGESVDHLFLHCPIALNLWHRLFSLGNVMWVVPKGSAHMLLLDFCTFGGSKRAKMLWSCAVFATFWVLWMGRNARLFEDKFREVGCLWDNVCHLTSFCVSGSSLFRDWLAACNMLAFALD